MVEPARDVDEIVERCRLLARDDDLRRKREDAARQGMRALPQSMLLAKIACLTPALPAAAAATSGAG